LEISSLAGRRVRVERFVRPLYDPVRARQSVAPFGFSGARWASRLSMFAAVWPTIRMIILSGIPAATIRETAVCRSVWKQTPSTLTLRD